MLLATWLVPWDPVPGGAPDPVPADSVFTADQIQRAEDYTRWARVWGWSSLVVSLGVACWLGFSARGRRLAERMPGRWWVQVILVVAALEVIGRLVTLPLGIAQRKLQLDVGLSTSSWPAWVFDLVKGELVDIVTTSIAVIALVGIARRLAARLAGRRRGSAGGLRVRRVLRLPAPGRAALQLLHAARGRAVAHPDLRARRRGGSGGRRRPRGRRVPSYDDAQRLRVRLRRDPPGRRLRHARRRPLGPAGAVGRRPRAGARPQRRRAHRHVPRRRRRVSSASACSACWPVWPSGAGGPGWARSARCR